MNMDARNQYLKVLQERYFMAKSKKEKSSILEEYCGNTHQNRKYVIRRINSSVSSSPEKRRRKNIYDGHVRIALVKAWEIFDYPCGQRLEPMLKKQVDNLRDWGELLIPDEVAEKLKRIASATIDRKLRHQKEVLHLKRKYHRSNNPLIYQEIPVKAGGWDRSLVGQVQIDLVLHCGSSASGLFINSLSVVDIATGWWEGEGIMGSGQERTFKALTNIRQRVPFSWLEMHSDNDKAFINWHLVRYAEQEGIGFSRSRDYKKNDNCFVEQKNSTHVRGTIGHLRYDTDKELEIINSLYRDELGLYKNFFQPVMKLKKKIRIKGKIHRKYDVPKTPYERLMESGQISEETKRELRPVYQSLNPAELKRKIDKKLKKLYEVYEEKNGRGEISSLKKQTPRIDMESYILNDLTTPVSVT
ncbi:MAG: ISNCY family transposase [Candidatus Aerophobetes bacterium]|nr:ISNCY family transposase [Candidatus Aerophobetes bacterium]